MALVRGKEENVWAGGYHTDAIAFEQRSEELQERCRQTLRDEHSRPRVKSQSKNPEVSVGLTYCKEHLKL